MKKIFVGIKVWSTNLELVESIRAALKEGVADYVELYVVPGNSSESLGLWRSLGRSFIVHCPHMAHGFNLANADLRKGNKEKFKEVSFFADNLSADTIIAHPGNGGPIEESIEQLRLLADDRICIENKPKLGLNGAICLGTTPAEIKKIMDGALVKGFVLDFSHAVCSANYIGLNPMDVIKEFFDLSPRIIHLNDGIRDMVKDTHLNLGRGSFDLRSFIDMVPAGSRVSLETPRQPGNGLVDFYQDRKFLSILLGQEK